MVGCFTGVDGNRNEIALLLACGDEQVRSPAGVCFVDGEVAVCRPKLGEFLIAKAGADAGVAVMHGDAAATDGPKEASGDDGCKPAARLAGDEGSTPLRADFENVPQGSIIQVMEE